MTLPMRPMGVSATPMVEPSPKPQTRRSSAVGISLRCLAMSRPEGLKVGGEARLLLLVRLRAAGLDGFQIFSDRRRKTHGRRVELRMKSEEELLGVRGQLGCRLRRIVWVGVVGRFRLRRFDLRAHLVLGSAASDDDHRGSVLVLVLGT